MLVKRRSWFRDQLSRGQIRLLNSTTLKFLLCYGPGRCELTIPGDNFWHSCSSEKVGLRSNSLTPAYVSLWVISEDLHHFCKTTFVLMFGSPSTISDKSPVIRRSSSRPIISELGLSVLNLDENFECKSEVDHMKAGIALKHTLSIITFSAILWRTYLRGLLFIVWGIFCCKVAMDSVMRMDANVRNLFLYEAFLYFNPPLLVAMMIWLWGVNIWVFLHSTVNYGKVFDLDHTHLTHKEIWKCASWMTIIVPTSMTSYLYLYSHGEVVLAALQPVFLYTILALVLVIPFDIFYMSSRIYFLQTLWRLTFPLQGITFADFFLADVLTSMAKVLSDLERSVCRMVNRQVATIAWLEADAVCGSHSLSIPCVLAFPYVSRFSQCLRQYVDTREKSCLLNALKYATVFPVIILSALKYHVAVEMWTRVYRPLWLFSSVINSCYSFYWDITCDWDFSVFTRNFKSKNPFLRPNLIYSHRWVYYWAIGSNLLLRCAWTYKLSSHLRHNYLTVFVMTALEIFRRFQWSFFRVENEWIKISPKPNFGVALKEVTSEKAPLLGSIDRAV